MSDQRRIDSDVFNKFTLAIRFFKLDEIKEMIAQDPALLDKDYLTHSPISVALHSAVAGAAPILVKLFLEKSSAAPEVIKRMMHDSATNTHVLREALQKGHEDIALMILKHDPDIDMHQISPNHNTPMLMLALSRGLATASAEMIARGARITDVCPNFNNRNALHWAARGTPATIDLVYPTLKDSLNVRDTKGCPPFMHAVDAHNIETTFHLAKLGAYTHLTDQNGMNALMLCANNQKEPDLLHGLLSLGLDPMATDNDGCCALHYIGMQPWMRPERPASRAMIKILTANGLDINERDNTGRTPLMVAAANYEESDYKVNAIVPFLRAGADPTLQDKSGKTAADHTDNERMKEIIIRAQERWRMREKIAHEKQLKEIDTLCHSGANNKTPVMHKIALKPRKVMP